MTRVLIYLFPALFDAVLTCAMLTSCMRMAASGAPATATTGVMATWAITYALASLLLGRWVTPRNASWLLIVGGGVAIGAAGGFIVFPSLPLVYLFTGVLSVGCALFFTPFQVFMKDVEQGQASGSVVRSTALYTFSWSSGAAAGPFVAGVVWSLTGAWQWGYVCSGALALTVAVGVLVLRRCARGRRPARQADVPDTPPTHTPRDQKYAKLPDLAWLGWVGSGAGIFGVFLITGMFPVTGKFWSLTKAQQGIVIAIMMGTQAVTGLGLGLGRTWMYRRSLVAAFGLLGAAGLVLYALGQSMGTFCLAAVCFGLYSGTFFFYLVFHAIVHPHRSARYVSVNEAVVGACGFAGPMVGGLLADGLGLSWPYFVAAGLVAVGILLKMIIHTRYRPQVDELLKCTYAK